MNLTAKKWKKLSYYIIYHRMETIRRAEKMKMIIKANKLITIALRPKNEQTIPSVV